MTSLRLPLLVGFVMLGLMTISQATPVAAAKVTNPLCATETANFSPGNGQDIIVPPGFSVSVFAQGLNFPTGIAFTGKAQNFKVYVLESGHGLPSQCNDETKWPGGTFAADNPFTPDILVFDQHGTKISGPLAKPTASGGGLQPHGPAIDIAFEKACRAGGFSLRTPTRPSGHLGRKTTARAS